MRDSVIDGSFNTVYKNYLESKRRKPEGAVKADEQK